MGQYEVVELLELARQGDPALDPADVTVRAAGRYLDEVPDRRFARYGLDAGRVAEVRRQLAARPR